MNKALKIILIILVIGVLAFVGLTLFSDSQSTNTGSGSGTGLRSVTTSQSVSTAGQNTVTANPTLMNTEDINREFVSMLLNLEAIRLNDDIFSEPAFRVLRDNSIRLNQPGNEGRPNPFAPIGIDLISRTQNSASVMDALDSVDTANEATEVDTGSISTVEEPQDGPVDPESLSNEEFEQFLSELNGS